MRSRWSKAQRRLVWRWQWRTSQRRCWRLGSTRMLRISCKGTCLCATRYASYEGAQKPAPQGRLTLRFCPPVHMHSTKPCKLCRDAFERYIEGVGSRHRQSSLVNLQKKHGMLAFKVEGRAVLHRLKGKGGPSPLAQNIPECTHQVCELAEFCGQSVAIEEICTQVLHVLTEE
jgi:hypothetical protein